MNDVENRLLWLESKLADALGRITNLEGRLSSDEQRIAQLAAMAGYIVGTSGGAVCGFGTTTTSVSAASGGTTPGTGTATLYALSGGTLSGGPGSQTVYNQSVNAIASGKYIAWIQDANGNYLAFNGDC